MRINTLRRLAFACLMFSFLQSGFGQPSPENIDTIISEPGGILHNMALEYIKESFEFFDVEMANPNYFDYLAEEDKSILSTINGFYSVAIVCCGRSCDSLCPCEQKLVSLQNNIFSFAAPNGIRVVAKAGSTNIPISKNKYKLPGEKFRVYTLNGSDLPKKFVISFRIRSSSYRKILNGAKLFDFEATYNGDKLVLNALPFQTKK